MKMSQRLTRFVSSYRFLAVCLGVVLSLSGTSAWAQTSQVGTVVGQVTDEQNSAVPGASIKLTDSSTNTVLATTSNNDGRYSFSSVPPATYNISIVKQGFNTYDVNGQAVELSSVLTVNAVLKVGSTATTVEVSATAGAQLQTMNATVGANINADALAKLPNMSRDVTTLALVQPGTTLSGQTAGSAADANTYTLDGANITDDMSGNVVSYQQNSVGLGGNQSGTSAPSGVIPTPIESIEEIRVNVSNQTSDFNNSSGGQIQMASKRGTNTIHGSAYMYYFDTVLGAANTWSNNHTPATVNGINYGYTPLVSNHRTRYGGALGGPIVPKNFLGGKWYAFFNYEALRFPNVSNIDPTVPSVLLRAGIIQEPNASTGAYTAYNIGPAPVTVNGVTYQPAVCPAGACDPRGIGMSPQVTKLWNTYMPLPNNPLGGDEYNTQGLNSTLRQPLTSNSYVGRIDHDFNDKWHWFASYRDFKLVSLTNAQLDIGGFFPGDTLGVPKALSPRPQQPSVWTTGLTTIITPTVTNTFVFDYLRTFWQWSDQNGPPQFPGQGGALEIGGESASALIPYNVNSQGIRQRFWDGQDKAIKDDLSMLKGNHLFSFGGSYQHNNDYHSRTDNGAGVNDQVSYLSTNSGINWSSPVANAYIPTSVASSSYTGANGFENYYAYLTGMLSSTQVMYTRALPSLSPLPIGTPATDRSNIPSYTTYFNDSWHIKPSFTLTYGLGWSLEMPPVEMNGKQVELVDSNNEPIVTTDFLAQRQAAALQGGSYTPQLGYSLIGNIGNGPKYPYNPYYGEFSPRVSFAWNPRFSDGMLGKVFGSGKTVLRGGYSRIFGRLNGVDLILVPLLGPGLLQGVTCVNPLSTGACAGSGVATPQTAFRVGPDGLVAPLAAASPTFPQPFFPGVGSNPESVDANTLDPNFKPDRTDQFTLTVQREISSHMNLEVGYIGKIIRNEFTEINLDSVPYMETLNGQAFSAAYAQVFQQMFFNGQAAANVTAQPFFEAALGGSGSAYCAGYSSCTAALASKNTALFKETAVSDIWSAMTKAPSWTLGRTVFSQPVPGSTTAQATSADLSTSLGYGNYNALFVRFQTTTWHGLTAIQNFTWGRALGTGFQVQATSSNTALTPFNLGAEYGPQSYDIRFIYNTAIYYSVPYFRSQKGVLGHILGGWTIAPLFTAQSGSPTSVSYSEGNCTGCEAFGEVTTPGTSAFSSNGEAAVGLAPYTGSIAARYNEYFTGANGNNLVEGAQSVSTKTPAYGLNAFQNPAQVWSEFRPCVLGYDTRCSGGSGIRGLPTWNLDTSVTKDIGIYKERLSARLYILCTNTLNHFQPGSPGLSLTTPTSFGQITSQSNTPRNMEFGLRLGW